MAKKLTIGFLFTLVSFLFIYSCKGEGKMSNDIQLILKIDKETAAIGNTVRFTYTFFNNSPNSVHILPWGGNYAIDWISAYDNNGKKLIGLPMEFSEIKFLPSKDDFIFLGPKERYSIVVEGKLIKAELSKFNRDNNRKYSGVFIDFDNSVIFLEKPGNFIIKGGYSALEEWREKGKKLYNLKNIWVGKLESNDLEIAVIEK